MALKPEIGQEGGQQYPIVKSIQTFLGQMAEGGAQPATTVLKELLQNADDAGATEVSIVLDERIPPAVLSDQYKQFCHPAIIVRNNAPFRIKTEVPEDGQDDFTAIRDVASGHKRADSTAAGRFGIGFNSVYFLTDTPMIFSRREIHIFDLLHKVFPVNGWIFSLSEFPANSESAAGEIKTVLEWCLPKDALQTDSIGGIAKDADYRQAAFRLPFRIDTESKERLFEENFPHSRARKKVLDDMIDEAKCSILFLKSVNTIAFSVLKPDGCAVIAQTRITPNPSEFKDVLEAIRNKENLENTVHFERIITCSKDQGQTQILKFHVWHSVYTNNSKLTELRKRLEASDRAVPWVSIAIPLDRESSQIDGIEGARWRVFLPLLESGPSRSIFSGAFFVGPSRQKMEYRLDEGILKTEWNQALVEHGLVDLFSNISVQLPEIASDLLENDPKSYLALFPSRPASSSPSNLTEYFNACFSKANWWLSIRDIWGEELHLIVGDSSTEITLNMIPEWLIPYKDCFKNSASDSRRFVTTALGNALKERPIDGSGITVNREIPFDVAESVLKAPVPPKVEDLKRLLDIILRAENVPEVLEGAWAFIKSDDGSIIKFDTETFYIIDIQKNREPILDHLRMLPLHFESVEWVKEEGLAKNWKKGDSQFTNIKPPDYEAAIELMRWLPKENQHDIVTQSSQVAPIVDFLIQQDPRWLSDLKLGFMVRTANYKESRRDLGVIFLKASQSTKDNEALWEVWFRTLFAEVDPGFAKEIMRLLEKQPHCLQMLNSQGCEVIEAKSDIALNVLNRSLKNKPELITDLQNEINKKKSVSAGFSERISRSMIEYADNGWEEMDDALKLTLKHLPIHRTAEEQFVSLITDPDNGTDRYMEQFMLQTEDDLKDAPIEFASYVLLQCRDRGTKNFYRNRLQIEVHGRVAVLKDILKQIGTTDDQVKNNKLLNYLLTYYTQTVDELRESKDQIDKDEAVRLGLQLSKANFIPCLDGSWHSARECCFVTRVQEQMVKQKWPQKEIPVLIQLLFQGECIVRLGDSGDINHFLKKQNIEINEIDPHRLYQQAITSNSAELSLKERVRLINDNIPERPNVDIKPSPVLQAMSIPTLTGERPLGQIEYIDSYPLPLQAMKLVAPNAMDKKAFAQQMGLLENRILKVLRALCVNEILSDEVANRVVNHFLDLWEVCKTKEDRFSILIYIKNNRLYVKTQTLISDLDVVLVETEKQTWKKPALIFSPILMLTDPPLLTEEEKPNSSAPEEIKEVWGVWCEIRTKSQALQTLVEKVEAQKSSQKVVGELYNWIDRVYPPSDTDQNKDFKEALRTITWVLAKKDGKEKLTAPGDVIIHKGNDVLQKRFWVPTIPLPAKIRGHEKEIGFQTELEANKENLEAVCNCLSQAIKSDTSALLSVYGYVADAIEGNYELSNLWDDISQRNIIFDIYREEPRFVSGLQLFLGGIESEDLSLNLLCLGSGETVPKKAPKLYEALGIPKYPTLKQVLNALNEFDEKDTAKSYKNLVDTIIKFGPEEAINCNLEGLRIKTCDGSFQPLGQCYWDVVLGYKTHVQQTGAYQLIDTQSTDVGKLLNWVHECDGNLPKCLRSKYNLYLVGEQKTVSDVNALDYILDPWRQLYSEIMRVDSNAYGAIKEAGLNVPHEFIEFKVVEKITLCAQIPSVTSVEQSPKWEGPVVFTDSKSQVLISALHFFKEASLDAKKINEVDTVIAEEVLHCLGDTSFFKPDTNNVHCLLGLLERPSTVLRNLRERNRSHFIYQYQDQVADPEFTIIFDEYRKTKPGSALQQDLEEKLSQILSDRFVDARREQIRGYGYDEFSVITELLQNAEDAYVQRAWLGMEMPEKCEVVFRYENEGDGKTFLNIEYRGRPFNYYRHQGKENRAFMRDVEGVLRSAGSYKPHSHIDDNKEEEANGNIGCFGLGFKSVFLLSDCPEIHSGHWHFAIKTVASLSRRMPQKIGALPLPGLDFR